MAHSWEYDVVEVTGRGRRSPGSLAHLVQDQERRGWALMTVVTDPFAYGGRTWAYFKRPAPELIPA